MFERNKVEAGLRKDVRLFNTRLKKIQFACQAFGLQVTVSDLKRKAMSLTSYATGGVKSVSSSGDGRPGGGNLDERKEGGDKRQSQSASVCNIMKLYTQFIKYCDTCPKKNKKKYMKAYLEECKRRYSKAQRAQKNNRATYPRSTTAHKFDSSIFLIAVLNSN